LAEKLLSLSLTTIGLTQTPASSRPALLMPSGWLPVFYLHFPAD
jgi:hypothetical protein